MLRSDRILDEQAENRCVERLAKIMPDQNVTPAESLANVTVVELVSSIALQSFGLGYAALNLAGALERAGTNTFLASVDDEKDAFEACEEASFPRERLIRGSLVGPSRLRLSPSLAHLLSKIPKDGKVILHSHGLWTYVSYVAGALRKHWKCPLVLSPHGSLEPYALTISPRKKALASLLYERRNLQTASCLCALSKQEEASFRAYGYKGRVAVIPNGVNPAILCDTQEVAAFRTSHNVAPDSRVLLFLSRIARKKNLPLLLRTFARNVQPRPEWVLLIAGSDEGGHIHEVRALIQELGIERSVRLLGQLLGRAKACAFTAASVFVLPSHSEGLPIAVLEAMEYGKPVLVTDGWTMPVTTSATFGWKAPASDHEFGTKLLEAMNTCDDDLARMGRAGRAIVRENFTWNSIAIQACSLYASLLAKAPQNER
jgi:poly(glycerol-phosphate) alpha-glucosyltransferase